MIERPKPIGEPLHKALPDLDTRGKRSGMLKAKIGVIIKEHPNKTLSVLRRWLNDDHK